MEWGACGSPDDVGDSFPRGRLKRWYSVKAFLLLFSTLVITAPPFGLFHFYRLTSPPPPNRYFVEVVSAHSGKYKPPGLERYRNDAERNAASTITAKAGSQRRIAKASAIADSGVACVVQAPEPHKENVSDGDVKTAEV